MTISTSESGESCEERPERLGGRRGSGRAGRAHGRCAPARPCRRHDHDRLAELRDDPRQVDAAQRPGIGGRRRFGRPRPRAQTSASSAAASSCSAGSPPVRQYGISAESAAARARSSPSSTTWSTSTFAPNRSAIAHRGSDDGERCGRIVDCCQELRHGTSFQLSFVRRKTTPSGPAGASVGPDPDAARTRSALTRTVSCVASIRTRCPRYGTRAVERQRQASADTDRCGRRRHRAGHRRSRYRWRARCRRAWPCGPRRTSCWSCRSGRCQPPSATSRAPRPDDRPVPSARRGCRRQRAAVRGPGLVEVEVREQRAGRHFGRHEMVQHQHVRLLHDLRARARARAPRTRSARMGGAAGRAVASRGSSEW